MNKTLITILAGVCLASGTSAGQDNTSYQALDLDNDGIISEQEADAVPQLKEAWKQVDANMDGQVDRAEFSAFEITEPKEEASPH